MTSLPSVNPDWAKLPLFDRTGWKRLPFGAFAESINERVEPGDAADEPYVGLEHIDPQDLHIRRWGKASDVIGTKLRFHKGDIIFGRRRAYQRKLAVAEFDGICSAHAMVVRAKPAAVLPEFLPFLMMSDRFMRRAVEISVGSLSPTINWTTLRLETCEIPPIGKQHVVADLLWAAERVDETLRTLAAHTTNLRHARVRELAESTVHAITIGAVATAITSGSRGWAEHYSSEGALFLRITNLQRGNVTLDWNDIQRVSPPPGAETERTKVRNEDVLISITADLGLVALAEDLSEAAYVNQHIAKVSLNRQAYEPYLAATLLSLPPCGAQFRRLNDQGAKAGMNLRNVAKLKLPDLPRAGQRAAVAELRSLACAEAAVQACRETTRELRAATLSAITLRQ